MTSCCSSAAGNGGWRHNWRFPATDRRTHLTRTTLVTPTRVSLRLSLSRLSPLSIYIYLILGSISQTFLKRFLLCNSLSYSLSIISAPLFSLSSLFLSLSSAPLCLSLSLSLSLLLSISLSLSLCTLSLSLSLSLCTSLFLSLHLSLSLFSLSLSLSLSHSISLSLSPHGYLQLLLYSVFSLSCFSFSFVLYIKGFC